MNALTTNSTAMQSSALGVQNISALNQDQKRQKAEVTQSKMATDSNNKKSQGAEREISKQNDKASAQRLEQLKQKTLERTDKKADAKDVATKGKSEEARAIVRFESMLQRQEQMEGFLTNRTEGEVAHTEKLDEQKLDDAAAMQIVAQQQKSFDARYAYGALADSASVKNIHSLSANQADYNSKVSSRSVTGELKVEKFLPPVPITEIKAPIMPSDHLYALTEATENALKDITDKKQNDAVILQMQQKDDANKASVTLVSANDKAAETKLESASEGAKTSSSAGAADLDYGLAS